MTVFVVPQAFNKSIVLLNVQNLFLFKNNAITYIYYICEISIRYDDNSNIYTKTYFNDKNVFLFLYVEIVNLKNKIFP